MKRFWAANRSRKGLVLYANTRNPAVRVWLAALILLAGLLCGCSGQGLGTKVVVKSLYFDWQEGAYQVALLYTTSGDSADAGEAEPEAKLLKGEGDTPLEALRQAEKATTQTVFYGQNELLLIGPGAADERLFEVCRFLAHDSTGRPNMAVFRVDVEADFWTGMEPESLYPLLQQLEQAAGRSVYTQYLYRIGAQDDTLLPSLTVSEQGEKVLAGPLVLYRQGIPSAVWRAETANLAAAAAGQASTLEFELQLERGLVHFTVDAPSLYYRVQQRQGDPVLLAVFTGYIQKLTDEEGLAQAGDKALQNEINAALDELAAQMLADSFEEGSDVLQLGFWLKNHDLAGCRQLAARGEFYMPGRVEWSSRLSLL